MGEGYKDFVNLRFFLLSVEAGGRGKSAVNRPWLEFHFAAFIIVAVHGQIFWHIVLAAEDLDHYLAIFFNPR